MISCPNCGSTKIGLAGTRRCPEEEIAKTGIVSISYMGCFDCQIIFQKDKIDPSFYENSYRKVLHTNSYEPLSGNILGEHRKSVIIDGYLKRWGVVPKKCMDVGSSAGLLLRYLAKEYGCETIGVEPCNSFRKYSNDHGTNTIKNISLVTEHYDLVTTIHVLEHQVEPIPFLQEIVKRMSGYVFIEVPELAPSLPHHLLFTMNTLKDMVGRVGIKIIQEEKTDVLRILGML